MRCTSFIIGAFLSISVFGQNNYLSEYEAFRRLAIQEYNDFRDKANAEYAQYMRDAWAWYRGEKPMLVPTIEEPVVPPVVLPEEDREKTPDVHPMPFDEIIPYPDPAPVPQPISPIEDKPLLVEQLLYFIFYGTPCKVRFDVSGRFILEDIHENDIADMWEYMAMNYDNLLYDCLDLRSCMQLCDWGYVKLAQAVAETVYGPEYPNETILMQAFVLIQSGFKIHIARSDSGSLHMLLAADCDMYNYPYWELNGEHYYLLEHSDVDGLYVFTQTFPEEKPMRLLIAQEHRFFNKLSSERTLQAEQFPAASASVVSNENLMDFYNGYPASYANNDPLTKWRFYAQVPLSQVAKERLYPALRRAISDKSERDAANILINFVQTAFVYEFDEKVWGYDRAFFADETLYYPYSDCEDRSILFSRLIRDLLGLDVVLVYYPGHLATAVRFNENIPGDYISVNGAHYLICDPTYIYAQIGMTMPDMDNKTAKLIILENCNN